MIIIDARGRSQCQHTKRRRTALGLLEVGEKRSLKILLPCLKGHQNLASSKSYSFHLVLSVSSAVSIVKAGQNQISIRFEMVHKKWDIITPHARGIIGIFNPEGVLMLPKGL